MKPPYDLNARDTMQALPETHVDVDFMIVDYLACLAIDSTLVAIGRQTQDLAVEHDELNWQIDSLNGKSTTENPVSMTDGATGLRTWLASTHLETPLPQDLAIKLQLLTVADQLRRYMAQGYQFPRDHLRLPTIGMAFMDLCSTASAKVSETRWFDTGARFLVQAVLEDQREGSPSSEDLPKLCSWTPSEPAQISMWVIARQRYAGVLSDASASNKAQSIALQYPLLEFKAVVGTFLRDLMTTLDAPILIQVERGQLDGLSAEETQRLKARVGLR
ncbi:uncharacterized protein N7484_007714 [Penicillium longicatenatum]|uniref:uncharacterized protein n=1 Tax=Penicillium longicatenatum TaxID=1561947 RepID=UPI002546B0E4|nr:uncharacterized protein N7484_007714 [Penicillium longicatenatum]KAJ5639852.1 hypothetical protein N7484_007714 [Penicillium longicatenatum]